MNDLPETEAPNPNTFGLDTLEVPQLVRVLVEQQSEAVNAVVAAVPAIAKAVEMISERMRAGGALHYVGAGTSGRLGTLDAAEMPPTFGTPPHWVCAHIAGGPAALTAAIEGAEDDAAAGTREMHDHVRAGDAVVGISASGGAPYVVAAISEARRIGAWTLGVANSSRGPLLQAADAPVFLATGPEPLTGSTRLKAGTAQKIFLNALSTALMVRLGKVYDNLMVDVVAANAKLRARACRLVQTLTGLERERALEVLAQAGGNVKVAVVMAKRSVSAESARESLASHHGSLRSVLTV